MTSKLLFCCLVILQLYVLKVVTQMTYRCDLEETCAGLDGEQRYMRHQDTIASSRVSLDCRCTTLECTGNVVWMVSRDGSNNLELIDTSMEPRYERMSNLLIISDATGSDAGLYSCYYSGSSEMQANPSRICIIILGRARFQSCPIELDPKGNCNETTSIQAEEGGNLNFPTAVVFEGAGDCGNQALDTMLLYKGTLFQNNLIYSCATSPGSNCSINTNEPRILPSRPPSGDFNFNLTLSDIEMSDSGLYTLRVEVIDDGLTNTFRLFEKTFYVNVTERSATTTEAVPDETGTTLKVETETTIESESTQTEENSVNGAAIGAGVGVPLAVIIIISLVALVIIIIVKKVLGLCKKSSSEAAYTKQDSQAPLYNRDETDGHYVSPRMRTTDDIVSNNENRMSVATDDEGLELDVKLNSEGHHVELHDGNCSV